MTAPNGIDLRTIDASPAAADPADVIVVGRLLAHKRVDLLLEALAILRDPGPAGHRPRRRVGGRSCPR